MKKYRQSAHGQDTNQKAKKRLKFLKSPDILQNLSKFVPSYLPEELREDVSGEILMKLCDHKLYLDDIPGAVKQIITEQRKFLPSKYNVQLDGLEDWQINRLEDKHFKKDH